MSISEPCCRGDDEVRITKEWRAMKPYSRGGGSPFKWIDAIQKGGGR